MHRVCWGVGSELDEKIRLRFLLMIAETSDRQYLIDEKRPFSSTCNWGQRMWVRMECVKEREGRWGKRTEEAEVLRVAFKVEVGEEGGCF